MATLTATCVPVDEPARTPLLEQLGLHRPELRAWALYDWANSVFAATMIPIFPIYFAQTLSAGVAPAVVTARMALGTTIAMAIAAVLAPVLGAMADYTGAKKKMLAACVLAGVVATGSLFLVDRGAWLAGLLLFVAGNVAVTASFVFYESLLTHVARTDEMDRVSSAGYAAGYLGGGLLLALNLAWITRPEAFGLAGPESATRLAFLSAALWWGLFSIPLLVRVREPRVVLERGEGARRNPLLASFGRLRRTLAALRTHRQAFLMLLAFLLYNDAVNTVIRMGTVYGTELGISRGALMGAILMVQFVAIPFAFGFAALAGRIGPRAAIFVALALYVAIIAVAYVMTSAAHFFVLAFLVAVAQGGCQALSRSLFASMVPRHRSSEFFGFFGVFEKFAGVFGPALFALMAITTGSSRNAVASLVLFVIAGAAILSRVDVEEGRAAARRAEAAAEA